MTLEIVTVIYSARVSFPVFFLLSSLLLFSRHRPLPCQYHACFAEAQAESNAREISSRKSLFTIHCQMGGRGKERRVVSPRAIPLL